MAAADAAEGQWRKTISDWAAKKEIESIAKRWDLRGSIADPVGILRDQYHNLMLGEPVQLASEAFGLPAPAGEMLGEIVSEHVLPGDPLIKDLKRTMQFTGAVAGFASGNVHMACACVTSYMRDRVTEALSDQIKTLFAPKGATLPLVLVVREPGRPFDEPYPEPEPRIAKPPMIPTQRPDTITNTAQPSNLAAPFAAACPRQPSKRPYVILPDTDE